jgi:DNA-binding response OmpR family regulator
LEERHEPKPRVLVVEDEHAMADLLEKALTESGFEVTVARNGREGIEKSEAQDVLVVDVMMPVLNGYDMVRKLREKNLMTPALFLTARGATEDLVAGFEAGGDDYLVKPFKLAELLARLRSLIRRSRAGKDELACGDIWLDRRGRQARRGDRWLYLSNTELALLELFMLHQSEILSKAFIFSHIWHEGFYRDDNLVEVYINYLRVKLEAQGGSRVIRTVRGKGYVLESLEN